MIPSEDPRHVRLCELVAEHCKHHKDWVTLDHYYYDEHGLIGEVDVLAANKYGLFFYEIKSKHTGSAYRKAKEQFSRFKKAHEEIGQSIRGVYVTPEKIKRLK